MALAELEEAPPGSGRTPTRPVPELRALAGALQPSVLARSRVVEVGGPLGELLSGGALRRGSVVGIDGPLGAGTTSLVCALGAAVTATGEWVAVVDDGTFGGVAAAEAGVAWERLAVVRGVPTDRWSAVVAALLDGMTLVAARVPPRLRVGDARRLAARARERGAVLVPLGPWPGEAALRLHAEGSQWRGLGAGHGLLRSCRWRIRVEGKGAPEIRDVAAPIAAG